MVGVYLNVILRGSVLGQRFPKTQFEGAFLELEESGVEYDTFSACYTFPKLKNTYFDFSAFFSWIGCPRLTRALKFCSGVLPVGLLDLYLQEEKRLPKTNCDPVFMPRVPTPRIFQQKNLQVKLVIYA